jgi:hypothetical protein
VAEDVDQVGPDLFMRDKQGKACGVRYDQVKAMLLNEFLTEHRAFVKEQLKMADQQKQIDALKEEPKEHRFLIQKVSDKIDVKQSSTRWLDANPKAARRTVMLSWAASADFGCAEDNALDTQGMGRSLSDFQDCCRVKFASTKAVERSVGFF